MINKDEFDNTQLVNVYAITAEIEKLEDELEREDLTDEEYDERESMIKELIRTKNSWEAYTMYDYSADILFDQIKDNEEG